MAPLARVGRIRRRLVRLVTAGTTALVAGALLAGCVGIPTSGGIVSHRMRGDSGQDSGLTFLPSRPAKGASQEEILAGFIAAGTGIQNRFQVAREFLAGDLASTWNPNASVIVTDASRNDTVRTGQQAAALTVRATARVDADGLYTVLGDTTPTTLQYRFVRVRGEWRISEAPDGIVLTPTSFSTVFGGFPVYWLDPQADYLVPDLRWFPSGALAAERIVRAVLAGPAPWLDGAVSSSFPQGVGLGSGGVQLDGGTATVDLGDGVLSQSDSVKTRMIAQLTASLSTLGTVTRVRLTAKGFPVEVPAGGATPDADPQVGSVPIAYRDGVLGPLGTSSVRALAPLSAKAAALSPVAGTIDRGQTTVVVRGPAGVSRVPTTGDAALVDSRPNLLRPTIDPEGVVWSMDPDPGSLVAVDTKNVAHPLALVAAAQSGVTVQSFLVSRDGARIVLAVSTPEGPELRVASIRRDAQLVPTGFGPALSIPLVGVPDSATIVDLAWIDPLTVGVLTDDDGASGVRSQQIGGRGVGLGSPPSGRQLVGGNEGSDALRVVDGGGAVLQQSGTGGWQQAGPDVEFLVPQQ